ncbi:unnamed protein product [Mytilus coruscus]|uniref:Fucolectin tachylectin-4 pentraxin-1 domain-containing protein n=1 Tax=Mytilus coruscus TaxID=42192 RepID=A0A6J8ESM4_MYTCO|nr:unnamed protein product [Mytilus coruscus]
MEVSLPMWSLCAQLCSRIKICKSINFITWTNTCQINYAEPEGNMDGLNQSVGNSFVAVSSLAEELAGSCKGHDCTVNEVCIPQCPNYICVPLLEAFAGRGTRDLISTMLVHVGESLDTSQMELCGQFIGPGVKGQVMVTPCITFPRGYVVKLTSVNTVLKPLHLAEVEVYGVVDII